MIANIPPWIRTGSALDPADLAHHSRGVADPDGFDPSRLITSNFDQIIHSALFRGTHNNTLNGSLFEVCFWNALVAYGVPADCIEHCVDPTNGKNAEIDLLVHAAMGDVALLLKTSMRERWKQLDRDANAIRFTDARGNLSIWAVFHREHADDTPEKMIRHAEKTQRQFFTGGVSVRTVMDCDAMRTLFLRCGAHVPETEFGTLTGSRL